MRAASILLLLLSLSNALDVDFYYGEGCPQCATTETVLNELSSGYRLEIARHEVYNDAATREMMFREYDRFGVDIRKGGVPTTIIGEKTFIIGQMDKEEWEDILRQCETGCPGGVITKESSALLETDGTIRLTLPVLIGAAIVDSINPCTIAVMILLIGAILVSKGRRQALTSGLLFASTIFVMYMLYGFGILHAITTFELTRIFYIIVTIAAFILAVLEVRAYVDYRPGFAAVEMPMFLRPHAKRATSQATTPLGVVVAAVLCSLFLVPCSSGPYLMVLGMLAKAATLQTVSYLLLYNLIFILPMLIITALIYFGKTTVEKVGAAKDRYIRLIHLVSGIILFLLFFLMVSELQRIF